MKGRLGTGSKPFLRTKNPEKAAAPVPAKHARNSPATNMKVSCNGSLALNITKIVKAWGMLAPNAKAWAQPLAFQIVMTSKPENMMADSTAVKAINGGIATRAQRIQNAVIQIIMDRKLNWRPVVSVVVVSLVIAILRVMMLCIGFGVVA